MYTLNAYHLNLQSIIIFWFPLESLKADEPLKKPTIFRPASFQADARSRDHYLITGIIEVHNNVGFMECKRKCEQFGLECQSSSFSEYEKKCFLHDIILDKTTKADYVYKKGYVYYERV